MRPNGMKGDAERHGAPGGLRCCQAKHPPPLTAARESNRAVRQHAKPSLQTEIPNAQEEGAWRKQRASKWKQTFNAISRFAQNRQL